MEDMNLRREALRRAIDLVGGQTKLAAGIGVRQNRVNNWLNRDHQVTPAEYCSAIQKLTNGAITCSDLRPDVFRVGAEKPAAVA
jgi:DNA-binding transcriptional regulator YdaS (Cro superfamily)